MRLQTRRARGRVLWASALVVGFHGASAFGQTTASWLSPSSGTWTNPIHWSTNPFYPNNGQPNAAVSYDVVVSPIGNNYTISLSGPAITINSLNISSPSATLVQNVGSLTVLGSTVIGGGYYLAGVFNGGAMRIDGTMDWANGQMTGAGTTTISPGAVLNCGTSSGSTAYLNLAGRTIENFGLFDVRNATISLSNGTILNMKSGVIDLDGTGTYNGFSTTGTPSLVNYGRIKVGSFGYPTSNYPMFPLAANGGTLQVSRWVTLGTLTHNNGSVLEGPGLIYLNGPQTLNSGTTTFAGKSIIIGKQGSGTVINGTGHLDVTGGLGWSAGTIAGSGTMRIAPGGLLDIGSGTYSYVYLARPLENNGTINLLPGGTLNLATGPVSGSLRNGPAGVINIAPNSTIYPWGGGYGTALINEGTINIQAGGAGTFSPWLFGVGSILTNSGRIIANSDMFLLNAGTHLTGSTLAGSALFDLGSSSYYGQHTLTGRTTLAGSNMRFGGGTIAGLGELVLTGTLDWNGGSITTSSYGSGTTAYTTIAAGATLNVGSATSTTGGYHYTDRTINNSGIININAGTLELGSYGRLNNLAGGIVNLNAPGTLRSTGTLAMTNAGTVNFMLGTGSLSVMSLLRSNAGSIFVHSGVLSFSPGFGSFTHLGGSTLGGVGTIDLGSSTVHSLQGATTFAGSRIYMNGGTMTGGGDLDITGTLHWLGGSMVGPGRVSVAPAGVVQAGAGSVGISYPPRLLARVFDNYGTFNFTDGTISLSSSFNNRSGGVLNIASANNFIAGSGSILLFNGGTMNLASGSINISVPFENLGVVNVGSSLLSFSAPLLNRGTINGDVSSDGVMTLLDNAAAGAIDGNGQLIVAANAHASAQRVRQQGLSIEPSASLRILPGGSDASRSEVAALSIAAGGVLDLSDNSLLVNYLGQSPFDELRGMILDGRINSSMQVSGRRLGIGEGWAIGAGDASSVLIRYTYSGDANLDGVVNVGDLGALATNWQQPGVWTGGDFNYDGLINVGDLGELATNWQQGSTARGPSFAEALTALGLPNASVPEPVLVGLGLASLSAYAGRFCRTRTRR